MHHGIYEIPPFGHYYDGLWERHNKGQGLKKNVQQMSHLLLLALCLYRIRSFKVVEHKLFYVFFKNATINFIIFIVNTLFLYNIIRMPHFVASDKLTLATFMFEPETFLP